jgi:hypothetical protein
MMTQPPELQMPTPPLGSKEDKINSASAFLTNMQQQQFNNTKQWK